MLILFIFISFLVFFWQMPFLSNKVIGADYGVFPIVEQLHLMFSIRNLSFPLYVPGYAGGGVSASTLTMGQIYHPISYIGALFPGYWDGKALEIYTMLNILSLGVVNWIVYRFLRRINIEAFFAFLLSFITVFNFRMLDLFRYGDSLQNYVAYLLLCTALCRYYISPRRFRDALFIILSTYLIVTSGHPQMMYLGFIGAVLVMLVTPFFIKHCVEAVRFGVKEIAVYYGKSFIFVSIGIILAGAYVAPFVLDFLANNAGRVGRSFEWALMKGRDFVTPFGVLNSLFKPFYSNVHGSFGGSSLLIIPFVAPLLFLRKEWRSKTLLVLWLFLVLILIMALGDMSPIYYCFWKYMPFASSFRMPGRVTIVLPFILLIMFVLVLKQRSIKISIGTKSYSVPFYAVLALGGLVLFLIYNSIDLIRYEMQECWTVPAVINDIPLRVSLVVFTSGLLALLGLIGHGLFARARVLLVPFVIIMSMIQMTGFMRYGTWVKHKIDTATFEKLRVSDKKRIFQPDTITYQELLKKQRDRLGFYGVICYGMVTKEVMKYGLLLGRDITNDTFAEIFVKHISAGNETDMYDKLTKGLKSDTAIILKGVDIKDSSNQDSRQVSDMQRKVKLLYSSFNKLLFAASSDKAGYFVLAYPYLGNWHAFVNGREVNISKANGIKMAVSIPAGENTVEFRYWSQAAFYGMLVSCFTAWLLLVFGILGIRDKKTKLISIVFVTLCILLFFSQWNYSLYHGKNLNTEYHWVG